MSDEALCFRLLSDGSLLWKIRYSSLEGREYTPPEIQQKYNLHSHHAWSGAYSFNQRHCDFRSADPLGCGFHVLRCSSFHGLLCVGLNFFFSSIQFHLLNFRSFFTFFGLHIYDFYGIIIQKMIEYSIYYKQVVPPCQEENVKVRCIFQIEYLQFPLYIVTAR